MRMTLIHSTVLALFSKLIFTTIGLSSERPTAGRFGSALSVHPTSVLAAPDGLWAISVGAESGAVG